MIKLTLCATVLLLVSGCGSVMSDSELKRGLMTGLDGRSYLQDVESRQTAYQQAETARIAGQQARQMQMTNIFDVNGHKQYLHVGTGSIKGQGFMKQRSGGVVTCAGSLVYLVPDTPFFNEIIEIEKKGKDPKTDQKLDPKYKAFLNKQSQCDAQGNFYFTDLPASKWVVITEVSWSVGYNQQGGVLVKRIAVNDSETNVILTDTDYFGR